MGGRGLYTGRLLRAAIHSAGDCNGDGVGAGARANTSCNGRGQQVVGMVLYHQTQPMTQEVMTQVMTRAVTQSLCAPRQCAFPIPGRRRIAVRDVSRRSCGGHDERAEHGSIVRTGCAVGHAERHAERHGGLE